MKSFIFTVFFFLCVFQLFGQVDVILLAKMPEPVTNNAITLGINDGKQFIYSFGGIDTTKEYGGIHKKVFKYDILGDSWESLGELPDGNGRIALAASTVKNKIYIIGGYEVHENGSEKSFDLVHIFNPETNSFEANGKKVPIPIDDHVQAVWRDSLIFLITGWSDNDNVDDVNIYNPSTDKWLDGDDVPGNSKYKAFGASGTIIGDTIYYLGGAKSSSFSMAEYIRIGVINPNDPTNIQWSSRKTKAKSYRSASTSYYNYPIWLGGSDITYNYDGKGYNGIDAFPSVNSLKIYHTFIDSMANYDIQGPMDLRGVVKISEFEYFLCGGMDSNRKVLNETKLITLSIPTNTNDVNMDIFKIYPNPASDYLFFEESLTGSLEFYNTNGQLISKKHIFDADGIDIKSLPKNVYLLHFRDLERDLIFTQKIVKK